MGPSPKSRSLAGEAVSSVKLDSWKEIASYLGRDPRTVQLWEKHEGLPVHRLAHQSRSSVYAYAAELDAWVRTRSLMESEADREMGKPALPFFLRAKLAWALLLTALLLAAGVLAFLWLHARRAAGAGSTVSTLVVLPFDNLTSAADSVADAMTDNLIGELGRIGKVHAVAGYSMLHVQGANLPIEQIASQLHAAWVLRGAVAEVGHEPQVTVELLDAVHNKHLWGATYTRETSDLLAWQDAAATKIAAEVTRVLTGYTVPAAHLASSANAQARQDYLAGRFYWNRRDLSGLEKAIDLYNRALVTDPNYAPAYAGLALVYDLMTDRGVYSDAEAFQRARTAAQNALAFDPMSAEAYTALAFAAYRQDWDFTGAEQNFRKAIALNPGSAVAHQWYGEFLGDLGRFPESIEELRRARELDPLSPMVSCDLADGYLHANRLAEAMAELHRLAELYPGFLPAYLYRIDVESRVGDFTAATADARIYFEQTGDRMPLEITQVRTLAAAGRRTEARQRLASLLHASGSALRPYRAAQLLFLTGQEEAGYQALERAYRAHSWWLVTMLVDPGFDRVHTQERFLAVARRVGLPQVSAPALRASLERSTH